VLNNATNFHVFNEKKHILHFMANANVFKDAAIEEDEYKKDLQEAYNEMKGNTMLKGVVFLKK